MEKEEVFIFSCECGNERTREITATFRGIWFIRCPNCNRSVRGS